MSARDANLRDLIAQLPKRITFSDRLQNFAPERRDALFAWLQGGTEILNEQFSPLAEAGLQSVSDLDGLRMTFANGRVIHLRGSGNAPELRCYTEAENAEAAAAVNHSALELVAARFPPA